MDFDKKALRRLRTDRDLSQSELGKMIGCSGNTISIYERGDKTPRDSRIKKIAGALGVPITALQTEEQSRDAVQDKLFTVIERMSPSERAEMLAVALRIEERRQQQEVSTVEQAVSLVDKLDQRTAAKKSKGKAG